MDTKGAGEPGSIYPIMSKLESSLLHILNLMVQDTTETKPTDLTIIEITIFKDVGQRSSGFSINQIMNMCTKTCMESESR